MLRTLTLLVLAALALPAAAAPKRIVLIAGDEEYRSEEMLPQLAKILTKHHGFRCTVLYALDPKDGTIHPEVKNNIPGLEALDSADLLVIMTRYRDLPDDQMRHIAAYLDSGKPVIGLRTATHAFLFKSSLTYARYNADRPDGGFGRAVLGETWVAHHGEHGKQSTRGVFDAVQARHPLLKGIRSGELWSKTDVYEVHPPAGTEVLVEGEVLTGMNPQDPPVAGAVNQPRMPIAWVRTYRGARVFTTTLATAEDLLREPNRRLLVNACYWALGLENRIRANSNVDQVGEYSPRAFGFGGAARGVRP